MTTGKRDFFDLIIELIRLWISVVPRNIRLTIALAAQAMRNPGMCREIFTSCETNRFNLIDI